MRPYLTVIVDSFHEALVSRVLWILIGISTLVLAGLAPFGLHEQQATELQLSSVSDWRALILQIKTQADADEPSPGKHLWRLGSDRFRKTIRDATGNVPTENALSKNAPAGNARAGNASPGETATRNNEPRINFQIAIAVLEELNQMLARADFYEAKAWQGTRLHNATRESTKNLSSLEGDALVSLNRRLLKAAFPVAIAQAHDEELQLTYLIWDVGAIPMTRRAAEPIIQGAFATFMDYFLGVAAVFIAILVTAPIIPHTFEPGAVDLLLSKPVSRPMLFLTKFFGGCAFILMNTAYVVVGLWLIMGFRFDMWNGALLLCIPLFLFLFLIYYSVSAFAAVVWRNSIVAIVLTIVFWAALFALGLAKGIVAEVFLNPSRITNVVMAGNTILVSNRTGQFLQWRNGDWEAVIEPESRRGPAFALSYLIVGPVYDAAHEELHYIPRFQGNGRMQFFMPSRLMRAKWTDVNWQAEPGPNPPTGSSWLFSNPAGETIVVATAGVFRFDPEDADQPEIFGFSIPIGTSPFKRLDDGEIEPPVEPFGAAMHPATAELAIFSAGKLRVLRRDADGKYESRIDADFFELKSPVALAFAGDVIAVAQSDGKVTLLKASDLSMLRELTPAGSSEPYTATATPDGRWFAVLFHDGTLTVFDANGEDMWRPGSDVSAVMFDGDEQVVIADRGVRASRFSLADHSLVERHEPARGVLRTVYRYAIDPLYTIFPKPGKLGESIQYLLTDRKTMALGAPNQSDLRERRVSLNFYNQIFSSLAFVTVMLSVTCVYLRRIDI